MSNSQDNQITMEPESRSNGVGHSKAQGSGTTGGTRAASSAELIQALTMLQQQNAALQAQVLELQAQANAGTGSNNTIEQLANAILAATTRATPQVQGPTEADPINRSFDFQTAKTNVDGRSMMEAQQAVLYFRTEAKLPISIPKGMAQSFGPTLDITVNGVRVSIPCDGKTYFINETHYEHAKERMAKVDILNAETESQIKEIG